MMKVNALITKIFNGKITHADNQSKRESTCEKKKQS